MTAGTNTFYRGEDPLRADKLNAAFEERLLRVGDSMVGSLILAHDPAVSFEAATKQYVDAIVTSNQILNVSPTPPTGVADNTLWWDPIGCQLYIWYFDGDSRQWVPATTISSLVTSTGLLPIAGGTLTGPLILAGDPVDPLGAATKQYVDAQGNRYLLKTGGTVSGNLAVAGSMSAPVYGGGASGAGVLSAVSAAAQISFGWDFMNSASYQLALRVNDGYINHLCTATNCQALNYTPWIGSPINVGLAGADFANRVYGVAVDAAADHRIKTRIEPTSVDALSTLNKIQVSSFDVKAAAVAALQPVSQEQKKVIRTKGNQHVAIGLVAQQVKPLIPEMVNVLQQPKDRDSGIPEDLHHIVLKEAVPYLIKAIQQLTARVQELEAR